MAETGPPSRTRTWAQIDEAFRRALETPTGERGALLDRLCPEPRIRAEVDALLAAHERAGGFLEDPAVRALLPSDPPALDPALPSRIGQYRVIRLIGEGGMGVVYLAEDTRLGRIVALKALAPRLISDAAHRERLRREARAAASLNHPGIAAVYALEEFDDHLYIAGEYVDGETLRDELRRGRLEPRRVVDTAMSLARAVAAAHARGIVHRDLKPENVIRSASGDLKILDFGLARLLDAGPSEASLTGVGTILGTPAYMSPEQIRGDPVDARSDVFALGVVYYELSTGVHPFVGPDLPATFARILEAEPASLISRLPPGLSPEAQVLLDRSVMICLRKSPADRFASAAELADALADVAGATESGSGSRRLAAARYGSRRGLWWWQFHQAAAAVAYLLLLVPLWQVRDVAAAVSGLPFFVAGLVGAVVATLLRLHAWFVVQLDAAAGPTVIKRSWWWTRASDLLFTGTLITEGLLTLGVEPMWSLLLIGTGAAVGVSFAIIEPSTAEAAFGDAVGR